MWHPQFEQSHETEQAPSPPRSGAENRDLSVIDALPSAWASQDLRFTQRLKERYLQVGRERVRLILKQEGLQVIKKQKKKEKLRKKKGNTNFQVGIETMGCSVVRTWGSTSDLVDLNGTLRVSF